MYLYIPVYHFSEPLWNEPCQLFIYEEPALTLIYEYTHLKPVEAGVLKEKINHVKDKVNSVNLPSEYVAA